MIKCDNNLKKAKQLLVQRMGHAIPAKSYAFLRRWNLAFKEGRYTTDCHRTGAPSKLEEKQIKVATEIFAAGFKQRGSDVSMPFSSFNQALRLSKQLAKIVSTAKVHPKTLWRAIKASKPTLKQRSLEIYQPLSESQKQARLEACQTFIDMPRRMLKLLLRRIVWIDAAKIWVSVDKNNKVWVDTSSESTLLVPDHRAAGKRCPKVCLAYYAAVNSEIGPVYFGLTSGTQGLPKTTFQPAKVQFEFLYHFALNLTARIIEFEFQILKLYNYCNNAEWHLLSIDYFVSHHLSLTSVSARLVHIWPQSLRISSRENKQASSLSNFGFAFCHHSKNQSRIVSIVQPQNMKSLCFSFSVESYVHLSLQRVGCVKHVSKMTFTIKHHQ